jgi:hypothetical protein
MVPGTTKIDGIGCDDCGTSVSLPFPVTLYGQTFNSATAGSNGHLTFGTAYNSFSLTCLPNSTATYVIAPYWVDQRTDGSGPCTGCGIYTSVTGTAPNRVFAVEYRTVYYNQASTSPTLDYEVLLFEGQTTFTVVYGNITAFAGTDSPLTIGAQFTSSAFTSYACLPDGSAPPVTNGQKLTFTYSAGTCPSPTPTNTATPTATATATNTPICPGDWTTQAVYPISIFDHGAASQGNFIYSFGGTDGTLTAGNVGKSTSGKDKSGTGKSKAETGTGGGNSKVNVSLVSAYKYDSVANTWSAIASLPSARQKPGVVSDGTFVWIVGGVDGADTLQNQVWRYDPAANTYNTAYASFTTSVWSPAVAYLNGKIYKIGGCIDGDCTDSTNVVEVYDIATNTWSTAAPLPQPIAWSMAIGFNGKVYVAGGVVPLESAKTYAYDPTTNTWDDAAIADLPATDWGATSGIVDGKWSIAGGVYAADISNTFLQWNPNTNTWALNDPMPQPRYRTAGGVINNALYVVGGSPGSFVGSNDNQRYFNNCAVPTNTPTATATSTPGVRLIGHVTYQGIGQPNTRNVQAITLTLCIGGSAQNFVQNTDSQGFFTVTLGTAPGNYNYRVKSYKNLGKAGTVAIASGTNNVEFGLLNTGDTDNNNLINTTDFTRLRNAFGTSSNPFTDFNNDGITNTTDFTLMRNNFGTAGQNITCP